MLKLRRKFHSKRRLHSASSSTAGSASDLDDRVVMLCEDVPANGSSFDSGRGSQSPGQRSSRGSRGEERECGPEAPRVVHLSRERSSSRQACYAERERDPARPYREYYIQRVVEVYEPLKCAVLAKASSAVQNFTQ